MRQLLISQKQTGIVAILIVIALLAIAGGAILSQVAMNKQRDAGLAAAANDVGNVSNAERALIAFVAINKRLPCPASPTSTLGAEGAVTPFTNCTSADGVLPWGALGISADDALDAWGRKLSYRVYSGATGFTGTNGLNALDCNTSTLLSTSGVLLDANGQCADATKANATRSADFSGTKGLSVNDAGSLVTGVAYVLISHGPTGLGSYSADHTAIRKTLPNSGGKEIINTTAASDNTYWRVTNPAETADSGSANFFDDVVTYRTLTDLLGKSGLNARDWGWVTASMTFGTSPATTPPTVSPNQTSGTPPTTATLTITLENSSSSAATLKRPLRNTFPSGLALAANLSAANMSCTGATISGSTDNTFVQVPINTVIPAATGTGGSKVNGTCTIVATVKSTITSTTSSVLTNSLSSGGAGIAATDPTCLSAATAVDYLCTDKGWNLASVSATLNASLAPPTLTTVTPAPFTPSDSAQSLTFTGTGFLAGAQVELVGSPSNTPTLVNATFVSSTQLTLSQILDTSQSSWTFRVLNPDGQYSGSVTVAVNAPVLTTISPSSVTATNTATTFTLTGTGFVTGATVRFTNGGGTSTTVTPSGLTGTSMTASFNLGYSAQTWTVRVINPDAQQSNSRSVVISFPANLTPSSFTQTTFFSGSGLFSGNCATTTGAITFGGLTITPGATAYSPQKVGSTNNGLAVANSTCGGGATTFSSANGESIRIAQSNVYQLLGLRLTGFTIASSLPERATVTFYNSVGTQVGGSTIILACSTSNAEANYFLTAPGPFTTFQINATVKTNNTTASTFALLGMAMCATGSSCLPTGASAGNNCP